MIRAWKEINRIKSKLFQKMIKIKIKWILKKNSVENLGKGKNNKFGVVNFYSTNKNLAKIPKTIASKA